MGVRVGAILGALHSIGYPAPRVMDPTAAREQDARVDAAGESPTSDPEEAPSPSAPIDPGPAPPNAAAPTDPSQENTPQEGGKGSVPASTTEVKLEHKAAEVGVQEVLLQVAKESREQVARYVTLGRWWEESYTEHAKAFGYQSAEEWAHDVAKFWLDNKDRVADLDIQLTALREEVRRLHAQYDPVISAREYRDWVVGTALIAHIAGTPVDHQELVYLLSLSHYPGSGGGNGGGGNAEHEL